MIDRKDFLTGKPFHYRQEAKTRPFKFERQQDWKKGDPMGTISYFSSKETTVTKVGYTYFDCCNIVLHKVLKARIYFKDLYL